MTSLAAPITTPRIEKTNAAISKTEPSFLAFVTRKEFDMSANDKEGKKALLGGRVFRRAVCLPLFREVLYHISTIKTRSLVKFFRKIRLYGA